jgi:hypothetical protein
MTISTNLQLEGLLKQAVSLVQHGDKKGGTACYRQVLQLDPQNKTALHWLAWHTANVYEAHTFLEKLAVLEPDNTQVSYFLARSTERCQELDKLVSNSSYLSHWNQLEMLRYRILRNQDDRHDPIPLLGQLLLKAGFISNGQLAMGLKLQKISQEVSQDKANRLGEILLDCGYITQDQLEQVIKQQLDEYYSQFY